MVGGDGDDNLSGRENDDLLQGGGGTHSGDGGPEVIGDRCVSIEVPTSCESF